MTLLGNITGLSTALAIVLAVSAGAHASDAVELQLNKVEPAGKGCRIYMVFANKTSSKIASFKPDLVFFDTNGVVADRLVVEGGPLPAGKTRVKLFDVAGLGCGAIQRILLNDIRACGDETPDACLAMTRTSSLGDIAFIK